MITVIHKIFKICRTNGFRYILSDSDKDFFRRLNKSHLNNSFKNNNKLLLSVNCENEYGNIHSTDVIEDVNFIEKNCDIDIKSNEIEKRLRKDKILKIINSSITDDQVNSNINSRTYKPDSYSKRLTRESINNNRCDIFTRENESILQQQSGHEENTDFMTLKSDFVDQSKSSKIDDLSDQFYTETNTTRDKKIFSDLKSKTLFNSSLHMIENISNVENNTVYGRGRKYVKKNPVNFKTITKDGLVVSTGRMTNNANVQPKYETVEIIRSPTNETDPEMKDEIDQLNELDEITENTKEISIESLEKEINDIELDEVENTPTKLLNIAPIIEKNTTILNLLKYGVDLYEIENNKDGANILARLNWDTQVLPLISFMKEQADFKDSQLAILFSHFPRIFRKDLLEIEEIFAYLRSRNFNSSDLASIISSSAPILNLTKMLIEKRFQEVEEMLNFTTNEMNALVIKFSKVLLLNILHIKHSVYQLNKVMGFSKSEVKKIVIDSPGVLMQHKNELSTNFTFLHRALNMSHKSIVDSSKALCLPSSTLSERVKYLIFLKRFQTDPNEPLYTPIRNIANITEAEFCEKIAHTSISKFRKFVKTL